MVEHHYETMKHCVYTYLSHIRTIYKDIREIEIRINQIRDRVRFLAGVDYSKITVSTSTDGDTIGEALATLDELQNELAERIIRYEHLYQDAKDLCAPRYMGRYILWLRNVDKLPWIYVAQIVGYEVRQAQRIAEGGIRELYVLMPREYQSQSIPDAL